MSKTNPDSSNSLIVTLIVIVIIALGVLFFLKPFRSPETLERNEIRKEVQEEKMKAPSDSFDFDMSNPNRKNNETPGQNPVPPKPANSN